MVYRLPPIIRPLYHELINIPFLFLVTLLVEPPMGHDGPARPARSTSKAGAYTRPLLGPT